MSNQLTTEDMIALGSITERDLQSTIEAHALWLAGDGGARLRRGPDI